MKRLTLLFWVLFAAFGQLWAQEQTEQTVTYLTKADFLKKIVDYEKNPTQWIFLGDKPCIIDFYADWCPPCRTASPILEDLAEEYKGKIDFYKVNTDREK
ncbi:MAG: redoxin domain-containing protein, partial [Salinivirgaceae bacterium]|nr:redoxin domain-containing protein [Salinivirgaceae bacterium]